MITAKLEREAESFKIWSPVMPHPEDVIELVGPDAENNTTKFTAVVEKILKSPSGKMFICLDI